MSDAEIHSSTPAQPPAPAPAPAPHALPRATPARTVILGIIANASLALVKLTAGILGNSYAMIADAVESFSDIASSLITLQAVRVAARPPDAEHPYGHGKAEAIGAMVVSVLLILAGLAIGIQAVREMFTASKPPEIWVLAVLALVVVVKEGFFRFGSAVAKEHHNTAVKADAWHHRADAITSILAFIGISLAIFAGPGWRNAEYWAAVTAAALIIYNGTKLIREPIDELLDRQATHLDEQVRLVARGIPGVVDVEKLFIRKAGPGYLADMHLQVTDGLNIREAHCISGKVRAACRAQIHGLNDVLIHLEPAAQPAPAVEEPPVGPPPAPPRG